MADLNINKVDLTNNNQKVFAGLLLVGVLFLLYWLLPPLVFILKNLWIAAILALPIVFVIANPMLVWNIFKQVSWNITKGLISGDKLGYMYRYHDYIVNKIAQLFHSIENLGAIRVKMERKASELVQNVNSNKAQAVKLESKGDIAKGSIRMLANKINVDSKQLESLLPKIDNIKKQEAYLKELHQHWVTDAEDLKYTLDSKADEYKMMKEMAEATGAASEFLKGNSEEYKIYQESLKQIETQVSQYTSNVENFESRIKPIIENLSLNREVSEDEGLKLIEEYKNQSINFKNL